MSLTPNGTEIGQPEGRTARLITISAAYGTGGSVVAPTLARRLGVPFVDRVTGATATRPDPDHGERLTAEEARTTPLHRLVASLTHAMPAGPTLSPPASRHHDHDIRCAFEADILEVAAAGRGVILGRAAAVVLGNDRGYHVRLDGPLHRRVAQGAAIEGVSIDEARAHMDAADKARTAYVRRLYRADATRASLYHLVIDSTAIPLETVVELILAASGAQPSRPQAAD